MELWKDVTSLTDKVAELRAKAQILQDSEGWGQLKVVIVFRVLVRLWLVFRLVNCLHFSLGCGERLCKTDSKK